jgi:hypothetical protein
MLSTLSRLKDVADVGQRHSGGGIRMVGTTGEHLGEWEKGEAYMILSSDTYANNKHLVDELIDTSLYRGAAVPRRMSDYFKDGGHLRYWLSADYCGRGERQQPRISAGSARNPRCGAGPTEPNPGSNRLESGRYRQRRGGPK